MEDKESQEALRVDNANKNRDWFLPVSILASGFMIAGSIVYLVKSNSIQPTQNNLGDAKKELAALGIPQSPPPLSNNDVILGDIKAPVTLIEYGDYQCPFCGRFFSQVEPLLRNNYINTGKLKMVFRNFQFLGPESVAAAEAALCAKEQSKFWVYHDALYQTEVQDGRENNGNLTSDLFLKLARGLKLDEAAFAKCINGHKYSAEVEKETTDAQSAGVNSTPTSFVNGEKLQGALPYAQFAAAIDKFLKTK